MDNIQEVFSFNWVDYVIVGIILLSTIISLARGFVREALSLITWVIAFWISFKFGSSLANILINYIKTPPLRIVVAFAIIFVVTLIIGGLTNYLLSQIIIKSGLDGTDRAIGMIFGLARGVLLIGVVLLFLNLTNFTKDEGWRESVLIPRFTTLIDWLHEFLPEKMNQLSTTVKKEAEGVNQATNMK